MKVMSMGKFQTSVVGETLLLEVIWEIPSSRPCREQVVSLGLAEPGGLAGRGAQGAQGLYRRGDPVLAVDEGELAVEVIESRELWERERERGCHWELTGNFWG